MEAGGSSPRSSISTSSPPLDGKIDRPISALSDGMPNRGSDSVCHESQGSPGAVAPQRRNVWPSGTARSPSRLQSPGHRRIDAVRNTASRRHDGTRGGLSSFPRQNLNPVTAIPIWLMWARRLCRLPVFLRPVEIDGCANGLPQSCGNLDKTKGCLLNGPDESTQPLWR